MPPEMPKARTQAQINAEAIAPGRQPTAPYNGWDKVPPNTQKILASRGYTRELFNASSAAKAREAVARYPLNANSFSNKLLDRAIPVVGAGAPPVPAAGAGAPPAPPAAPVPAAPSGDTRVNAVNAGSAVGSLMGAGNGGLSSLPGTYISGQTVNPVQGGASIDLNNGTITTGLNKGTATTPKLNKQGSAMTDKQMFKVAFLAKCIEEGLTIDEIKLRVKQALYFAEKKASLSALGDLMRTVPAFAAGVVALTAGGGYYGGKHIIGPGIHEAFKAPLPDKDDLLKEEIINEYDRQAETIKRQSELTKRRRERDRGMSGITRY